MPKNTKPKPHPDGLRLHRSPEIPYLLLYRGNELIAPVAQFLKETQARGLSPETLRAYVFDLLAFYRFLSAKNLRVDRLTTNHFVDFILSHRHKNVAPRTINRRLVVVRSFLNSQFNGTGDSLLKKYSSAFYKGRKILRRSRVSIWNYFIIFPPSCCVCCCVSFPSIFFELIANNTLIVVRICNFVNIRRTYYSIAIW